MFCSPIHEVMPFVLLQTLIHIVVLSSLFWNLSGSPEKEIKKEEKHEENATYSGEMLRSHNN
jgi:hypothetical protein